MDSKKREFLKFIAVSSGSIVLNNIFSFVKYNDKFVTVYNEIVHPVLSSNVDVFERYLHLYDGIQVYPGEGNILAAIDNNKPGISEFIKFAFDRFSGFFPENEKFIKFTKNINELNFTNEQGILHLGGPVANILGGKSTGYEYNIINNNKPFPVFKQKNIFRWGFKVGENSFGDLGKIYKLENGIKEHRNRYALIDTNKSNNLIFQKMNTDELPVDDWLLITKIPNTDSLSNKDILSIGGLHGNSLKKFSENLPKNFVKIDKIVKFSKHKYFQLLLPCKLIYSTDPLGRKRAEAKIDWDSIQYEPIV